MTGAGATATVGFTPPPPQTAAFRRCCSAGPSLKPHQVDAPRCHPLLAPALNGSGPPLTPLLFDHATAWVEGRVERRMAASSPGADAWQGADTGRLGPPVDRLPGRALGSSGHQPGRGRLGGEIRGGPARPRRVRPRGPRPEGDGTAIRSGLCVDRGEPNRRGPGQQAGVGGDRPAVGGRLGAGEPAPAADVARDPHPGGAGGREGDVGRARSSDGAAASRPGPGRAEAVPGHGRAVRRAHGRRSPGPGRRADRLGWAAASADGTNRPRRGRPRPRSGPSWDIWRSSRSIRSWTATAGWAGGWKPG